MSRPIPGPTCSGAPRSLLDRCPPAPGGEPLPRPARIAAAALGKRWQLPTATNEVRVLRGVDVPMRDGTVLQADVYLPATAGPHPTVLLRSPYGRGAGFRPPRHGAVRERGYAVVLQSYAADLASRTRGRPSAFTASSSS